MPLLPGTGPSVMDFRRSQLDDRRRRVLMEEVAAPADGEDIQPAAPGRRVARAYGEAVLSDHQLRISDLVPTRPFLVTAVVLLLLTGVAAIETLYICWQTSPTLRRSGQVAALDREQLAAIDLASRGNLASWYSSLLLAAGACGALAIFAIRCHRVDDYKGRYRVWLWTVAGLLWASLDAATGIHESIGAAMALLAGMPKLTELGWLALYLVIFGALAIRLGIETWHAVGSFSILSVAALLYLSAGMSAVGWITMPGYLLATVLDTLLVMLAHVTLVTGLLLYARHVHLDAEGKLPLRLRTQGPKAKRKSRANLGVVSGEDKSSGDERRVAASTSSSSGSQSTASASATKGTAASSSTQVARPGPLASRVSATISRDDDDDDAQEDGGDDGERLSKSERRRLKKLMRQQRRAA